MIPLCLSTCESSSTIDETLNAFLSKEKLYYSSSYDYLNQDNDDGVSGTITEAWREKMCEWAYDVVDHYELERELVVIAFDYLDRFFSKLAKMNDSGMHKRVKIDKYKFQLACATCLYLSMKLHVPRDYNYRCGIYSESLIKFFADLSRGMFSVKNFQKMELLLLQELRWQVHPVTSTTFISLLMDYLPLNKSHARTSHNISAIQDQTANYDESTLIGSISTHAHFFSELVIVEYSISNFYQSSEIAVACILAAMKTTEVVNTGVDEAFLSKTFLRNIRKVMVLSNDDLERVEDIQRQMYRLAQHLFPQEEYSPVSSTWIESYPNYYKKQRRMSSNS